MTRGLFHVHTDYSSDGRSTLAEVAAFCRGTKLGFALITDHAEDMSRDRMESLVRECARLSSPDLVLVPGLEFAFPGFSGAHLLGVGIGKFFEPTDVPSAVQAIRAQSGLAVLAHPTRIRGKVPDAILALLDGIEVWNGAYDSRYLPGMRSLALYRRARRVNPSVKAFAGLDMHATGGFKRITLEVRGTVSSREELVKKIRKGEFESAGPWYRLASEPRMGAVHHALLGLGRLAI